MSNRWIRSLGVAALLPLLACVSRQVAQLPLVSTKNLTRSPRVLAEDIEGRDCLTLYLGIIPDRFQPISMENALADALRQVPESDTLVSVELESRVEFYGVLSRACIHARGNAATRE